MSWNDSKRINSVVTYAENHDRRSAHTCLVGNIMVCMALLLCDATAAAAASGRGALSALTFIFGYVATSSNV